MTSTSGSRSQAYQNRNVSLVSEGQPSVPSENYEDDEAFIKRINSGKLVKHLYARHSNDFFAYLNLSLSTLTMLLLGRSVRYPSGLTWALGFPASEIGHVYIILQCLNMYRVLKYHPRVFQTLFGRIALLINGWSAAAITGSIAKSFKTRAEFSSALLEQKIQPRAGESSRGFASLLSLIPLFVISRRGKTLKFQRNIAYANMAQVDPNLLNQWKRSPLKLRNVHQIFGRGRISQWMKLDVLSLEGLKDAPVYVHIHGGGWIAGDKQLGPHALCQRVACRGIVVCIVNYRMSPECAFPAHIEDCKRALVFVKENCVAWGGDPTKVFVGGESAGGHLSALIGVTPNLPLYQPADIQGKDTSVAGSLPIYGVFDFTDEFGYHKANATKLLDVVNIGIRPITSRMVLQTKFNEETKHRFQLASPAYHLKQMLNSPIKPSIGPFFIPRECCYEFEGENKED